MAAKSRAMETTTWAATLQMEPPVRRSPWNKPHRRRRRPMLARCLNSAEDWIKAMRSGSHLARRVLSAHTRGPERAIWKMIEIGLLIAGIFLLQLSPAQAQA